ncbi:Nucleoporin nup84, partial [Podila epigama]
TVKAWLQEIAPKFTPIVTAKNYSGTSLLNSRSPFSFQTSSHLTGGAQSSENQDPDAATRDGAKLNDHNERAERDLLKTVWEYIRRGNMEEAKEACIKAGEHWRAESIGGGEFYTELPAFGVLDAESTDIPRGNKSRSLWKGTCYNLANDATADQYERAIYGALSGDVASVLPVCFTWEDHAWAQYNALVESMTEAQLSKYGRGDSCAELPLPQAHIDEAKDIFASIANSNKPELRSVVDDIFFKIQRGIILGQTNQLVTQLAKDARVSFNMGKALSPQMQRFLAHFVLLLRSKGLDIPKEDGDFFVNNYVEYLIAEKMYKIAPLYASYLPKDLQVKTCSKFLKGFTGPRVEREKQVAALRKYGVDLHGILIATVDQLLEQSKAEIEKKTDFASTLKQNITAQTSKQERQIVTILEWLSFSPSEYTECVKRGNSIIRKYLANGRLGAAFTLSNSLPFEAEKSDPFYETPQQMAMSKEYLHYQDLFSARLCFHEWQDAIQSKPSADAPRSEVQKWESLVKTKANQATEEIEKLLKSKWLSECKLPEDDARNNELEHLRKLYISELVMNLHQVYFDSRDLVPGFLAKSVAMVNLVASESVMLYEQMQESQRLQEFLAQIRLSSLELIKAGQSPFGF